MNLQDFINLYDDTYVDYDGNSGYQCVDIVKLWEAENGWPVISGNANQVINNAPKDFYEVVDTPQQGDIVVWDLGPYGHIGIYDEGTSTSFIGFEQNLPIGSPCHLQLHTTYSNIIGILRPRKENMTRGELEKQETLMSGTDQHQHAVRWALESIWRRTPTEQEVITYAGNYPDINKLRLDVLKKQCAKDCPSSCDVYTQKLKDIDTVVHR